MKVHLQPQEASQVNGTVNELKKRIAELEGKVADLETERGKAWGIQYCCNGTDCGCHGEPIYAPPWWHALAEALGVDKSTVAYDFIQASTDLRAQLAEAQQKAQDDLEHITGLAMETTNLRAQLAEAQRNGMGCIELLKQTADERDEAQRDSDLLRTAHDWIAERFWVNFDLDWGDWQDEMERLGLLVRVPATQELRDEYECDDMLVLRWNARAAEEPADGE